MSKHTPGPWGYESGRWQHKVISDSGLIVHDAIQGLDMSGNYALWAERDANARLIAAAPEMLEALVEGLEDVLAGLEERGFTSSGVSDMMEKAIAKAKGETNA